MESESEEFWFWMVVAAVVGATLATWFLPGVRHREGYTLLIFGFAAAIMYFAFENSPMAILALGLGVVGIFLSPRSRK
ncbi:hypothetical protein GCM10022251_37400 [Phytohabitans flavus]|uniref:Uncharacterized protein n=1 Tax=Phytohabitans flavus TaxID=1076124 RepID=A0A6F8XVV4_9ACTN|nr:hypothetical protein [Phytohabitans flavus]BCB77950.1 hypothetical protein Pflav_043600 [Phytohabitans flavus]